MSPEPSQHNHPGLAYVRYYEALTKGTVGGLDRVVTPDVRFKDPFSDVVGVDKYRAILDHMFEQVPDIQFTIHQTFLDGQMGVLRWTSTGSLPVLGKDPWIIEGMSELTFVEDGRVAQHIDFWDASEYFYARLPVIGAAIRFIQRRAGSQ